MICIDTETIHTLSEKNYENRMWLSLYKVQKHKS